MLLTSSFHSQRGMATVLHAASLVTFLQGWRHQTWPSRSSGALHLPHALLHSFIPSTPALSGAPGGHQRLGRALCSPVWGLAILVPRRGGQQGAGGWVPSVFGRTWQSSGRYHAESCSPVSLLV